MKEPYYLAWWNLENLFDTEKAGRSSKLKKQIGFELKGWSPRVLNKKVSNLAAVIKKMNKGNGPDLLGVCEVENRRVLKRLVKAIALPDREYQVVHHDCRDARGIDVAFIYDTQVLEARETFSHEVLKRYATRDLFQVNFVTPPRSSPGRGGNRDQDVVTPPRSSPGRGGDLDQEIIVVANHWPSRIGGTRDTEPYRILAAETLAYWMERIEQVKGRGAQVVVMGDFNDEPHSRSMVRYANSTGCARKVLSSRTVPRLYNLMWPLLGKAQGSYFNGGFPMMFDQILVSRGFLEGDGLKVKGDAHVVSFPQMLKGRAGAPRRFGRPSGVVDLEGCSDHLPVGVSIRGADVCHA